MFGAEGDRLAAMRVQQQQQYAEDLRRQIEEKQNKAIRQKRTPPAYSTTQSETMQDTVNNINYNNNPNAANNHSNENSPSPNKISVRPPNIARQNQAPPRSNYYNSPNRNLENNNNDNTYNQNNYANDSDNNGYTNNNSNYIANHNSREDYYSIPTTSAIAPLNLNVQPPSSIMATAYMMGPSSTMTRGTINADKSTFPSRLDSLESRLFNLREEMAVRAEKVNDFNDSIFPSINRDISDLRNRIEYESGHDIPQQIQPIRNVLKDQRNFMESINQDQREVHSSIGSTFSDLNGKISTFSPLFNDLQENSKSSFVTLRGDINRHRNQLETSNGKISKIESQDISIINKLSAVNEDFNAMDKGLSQSFDGLQISTNEVMQNITSQLAYDIQNESQQRETVSMKLQAQVSEVNDRSKSAISRLIQNIKQLDFKDSLEDIVKSISTAVNTSNNDTDIKVNDLTRRFDTFLTDCEENFGTIQNETVTTIEAGKANFLSSKEVLENALEEEIRIRAKNSNEFMSKYSQFYELIQQEEKLQMENCNHIFGDISFQLKSQVNDQLTPMYKDVHGAVYLISHIEETEQKLDKIERMLSETNTNIKDKMTKIQSQFKKLYDQISSERNSMNKQFDEIDRKIDNLQQKNKNRSILKRTEIHVIQKQIEIGLDSKVTSIEEEIAQIMKQIGEIQLPEARQLETPSSSRNGSRKGKRTKIVSKTDGRTEGSKILESLVNETSDANNNMRKASTAKTVESKGKQKKIIGEADNSLFLTNNKTMEITTDNDETSTTAKENDDDDDGENDKKEDYSKIGSNVLLETCQRFHFVPPENIFDQKEEEDDGNRSKVVKKASTIKFDLNNDNNQPPTNEDENNLGLKPKKSLSVPKFNLEKETDTTKPKFKVDTSFSSNSIKQASLSFSLNNKNKNNQINDSTSISNSSSSAHQIDETPLSATKIKLPFARTNEIEQIMKPEALATLPPHSLSQIIQSAKDNILSEEENEDEIIEEEEEEVDSDDISKSQNLNENENMFKLDNIPPELDEDSKSKLDEFKFNPGDFKIDLNIGNKSNKKSQLDQIKERVDKIVFETNNKKEEIEEEEEVND